MSEEEDTGKGGRENRWVKKIIQVMEEEKQVRKRIQLSKEERTDE